MSVWLEVVMGATIGGTLTVMAYAGLISLVDSHDEKRFSLDQRLWKAVNAYFLFAMVAVTLLYFSSEGASVVVVHVVYAAAFLVLSAYYFGMWLMRRWFESDTAVGEWPEAVDIHHEFPMHESIQGQYPDRVVEVAGRKVSVHDGGLKIFDTEHPIIH